MLTCKECKFWEKNGGSAKTFFDEYENGSRNEYRVSLHPSGLGECIRGASLRPPYPSNVALGYEDDMDHACDLLTGPEFGCVGGEAKA